MRLKFMERSKIFIWYEIDETKKAKVNSSDFKKFDQKRRNEIGFLGIAYIKYEKASAAARAMEEMNGTVIAPHVRPLKVRPMTQYCEKMNELFHSH